MCIPSQADAKRFVFQDADTNLQLNQDTQQLMSSSSHFGDEAFDSQNGENMKPCVQHNYHDHANDDDAIYLETPLISKGGVSVPFPLKLHNMLDHVDLFESELSSIIRWQPHGRCFLVKDSKAFAAHVLPRFFDQRKYASFQRQLNLYGFNRITAGPDKGSYYHELFLRSKKVLCRGINRMKIKGTGTRMASNPKQEPKFYTMEPMPSSTSPSSRQGNNQLLNTKRASAPNVEEGNLAVEIITPPTSIKIEDSTNCKEMPPLRLPMNINSTSFDTVLSQQTTDKEQESRNNIFLSSGSKGAENSLSLESQQEVITTMETTMERGGIPNDAPSTDLNFVFGNMPFHSIDLSKPYHGHRHSFIVQIASDESSCTPTLDEMEELDKDLGGITELGLRSDFSDHDMSQLLEKIVNQDMYSL